MDSLTSRTGWHPPMLSSHAGPMQSSNNAPTAFFLHRQRTAFAHDSFSGWDPKKSSVPIPKVSDGITTLKTRGHEESAAGPRGGRAAPWRSRLAPSGPPARPRARWKLAEYPKHPLRGLGPLVSRVRNLRTNPRPAAAPRARPGHTQPRGWVPASWLRDAVGKMDTVAC
jgi:hypothetical protein